MSNGDSQTAASVSGTVATTAAANRLPLRGWALELARRWNSEAYSLFRAARQCFRRLPGSGRRDGCAMCLLKTFLVRRLFPERSFLLFYDIGDGLTFGSAEMQKRFFEWLEIFDQVENTNFHQQGPPRDFNRLAPLLRRFFLRAAEEKEKSGHHADHRFPGENHPGVRRTSMSQDERMNLVTF